VAKGDRRYFTGVFWNAFMHPEMVKAGGGSIVNMPLFWLDRFSPRQAAYVARNFAVVGLTKVAALEYATGWSSS